MKQTIFILSLLLTVAFPAAADPVRTQVQYRSGTGADDTVQWDFLCSDGAGSGRWSRIAVPSQWELQGFGEYTYGRYYFGNPDAQPSQETGLYRHTFRVPAAWKGYDAARMADAVGQRRPGHGDQRRRSQQHGAQPAAHGAARRSRKHP